MYVAYFLLAFNLGMPDATMIEQEFDQTFISKLACEVRMEGIKQELLTHEELNGIPVSFLFECLQTL